MSILAAIASDATLDDAFIWLCKRRRDYPDHADIWDFRRDWPTEKARLQADLSAGNFRFGLLNRITKADGEEVDLWSARDALVLKSLTIVLAKHLPISPRCTHVKGHAGSDRGQPGERHGHDTSTGRSATRGRSARPRRCRDARQYRTSSPQWAVERRLGKIRRPLAQDP